MAAAGAGERGGKVGTAVDVAGHRRRRARRLLVVARPRGVHPCGHADPQAGTSTGLHHPGVFIFWSSRSACCKE